MVAPCETMSRQTNSQNNVDYRCQASESAEKVAYQETFFNSSDLAPFTFTWTFFL